MLNRRTKKLFISNLYKPQPVVFWEDKQGTFCQNGRHYHFSKRYFHDLFGKIDKGECDSLKWGIDLQEWADNQLGLPENYTACTCGDTPHGEIRRNLADRLKEKLLPQEKNGIKISHQNSNILISGLGAYELKITKQQLSDFIDGVYRGHYDRWSFVDVLSEIMHLGAKQSNLAPSK